MKEQTKEAVWQALQSSRAYVAFDWIADATGFDFALYASDATREARHEMGSRIPLAKAMTLRAAAPLLVDWRLLRTGKLIAESKGETFEFEVTDPGNYRLEAWLEVAGEKRIWILSNPIYVQ